MQNEKFAEHHISDNIKGFWVWSQKIVGYLLLAVSKEFIIIAKSQ
jgi:hypothetical protein